MLDHDLAKLYYEDEVIKKERLRVHPLHSRSIIFFNNLPTAFRGGIFVFPRRNSATFWRKSATFQLLVFQKIGLLTKG